LNVYAVPLIINHYKQLQFCMQHKKYLKKIFLKICQHKKLFHLCTAKNKNATLTTTYRNKKLV